MEDVDWKGPDLIRWRLLFLVGRDMASQTKVDFPSQLYLGSLALMAANSCLTERRYFSMERLWVGLCLAVRIPWRNRLAKIWSKVME